MAKTNYQTVDEYINTFPQDVQAVLQIIRQIIQLAVPEAEEAISYQLPAFKYHGWVFYFSAFKNHYNLSFPPPSAIFEVFAQELAPYETSKSAIKFPKTQPLPVDLIRRMAAYRAKENVEREKK
jgi:uncharacterized protein YdhG (YjbR/CyaY superfamily)